jgi:hypothetical protein
MHWPKEKGQKDQQRSTTHYIENQISIMSVRSDKWNVHCYRYCMSVGTFSELLFESVICCNNYAYFRFIMEKQSDRPTRVSSLFIYYLSLHKRCTNTEQRYILNNYVLWGKCTWNLILKLVCPVVLFSFVIVLPVLRFTSSGYPFSILKLFLRVKKLKISSTFIDFIYLISDILHSLMNIQSYIYTRGWDFLLLSWLCLTELSSPNISDNHDI